MTPLRIGIDGSTLGPEGASTHLIELLSAVNPARDGEPRITVWCDPSLGARLPARDWLEVRTPRVVASHRSMRPFWSVVSTREIASACDVLFVPGGLFLGRFRPFVTMSRNLLPFDLAERSRYGWSRVGLRLRLLTVLLTRTFRRADGVIFLTNTARGIVERRTGRVTRGAVIPHGVSERFVMVPRPQQPVTAYDEQRPFRWLYVSPLEWYKHPVNVARAVAAARQRGLPVALDLVGGSGAAHRSLDRFLDRADPRREFIKYHGSIPYERLAEWYRGADAAIFASSCENLPNTLVEMMSAGLPIACSSLGVMPEVFGDSGVMFDPRNAESTTEAVERLTTNAALRTDCASRAHARAHQYSWDRCAEETVAFLGVVARAALSSGHGSQGTELMGERRR